MELVVFVLTRACKPTPEPAGFLAGPTIKAATTIRFPPARPSITTREGPIGCAVSCPGVYTGRTRHFHVKVQPRGGRVLTTQLYFPGGSTNRSDGLFRSELLMRTAKKKEVPPGVSTSCSIRCKHL